MRIYYTNKKIFWNNETSDFLEKEKFDEYLGDDVWVEIRSNKSINWSSHYSASFYATDNFEATYFKVVKSNQTYYFFVDDIVFDSSSGKEYSLSLDLYNTYSIHLIEKLKQENPNVYFARKHTNRYWKKNNKRVMRYSLQPWCFQLPQYLQDVESSLYPTQSHSIQCIKLNKSITWLKGNHGTINDDDFDSAGLYTYLRMKIGNKLETSITLSPIVYYPIYSIKSIQSQPNSFTRALQYSQDMVIDICTLPIPPSAFVFGAKVKEVYTGDIYANDESVILFHNIYGRAIISREIQEPYKFINIDNDEYNINNIENEIMLLSPQCRKITITDKEITIPYYFSKSIRFNDGYVDINELGFDEFGGLPYGSFYTSIGGGSDIIDKMFTPSSYITTDTKLPFISNVYTSYLANNYNSMKTEIALANEQKEISQKMTDAQWGVSLVSSAITGAMGGITAGLTGGKMGLGAVGDSISGILSSTVDREMQTQLNNFNLKKVTAQQEALKSDLRSRVGDMKDEYGKGQLQNFWFFHISELPHNEKLRVFTDIYFNGYITNTVFKFNDYDNRINFNYFELKNVFALCSQYLKLPKSIMTSIAKQLESGIRLWKTPNFDYTLTLDNREKSYEIN